MVDDGAESLAKRMSGSITGAIGKATGDRTTQAAGHAETAAGAAKDADGVTNHGAGDRSGTQGTNMAADASGSRTKDVDAAIRSAVADEQRLILYGEKIEVSRRRIETAVVRASRVTRTREQLVEAELSHERVEVERIPVGRTVDSVPPVRQEGDTTILSVVEEVVVVERRLVLKEEVHIRRVKTTEHHSETVTLREQEAAVTRTPLGAGASASAPVSEDPRSNSLPNKDPMP